MRTLLLLSAMFVFGPPASGTAQEVASLPRDTVAWVGRNAITARDLRFRIEVMPWPGRVRPSTVDSVKAQALYALIGEQLLAEHAVLNGLSGDENTARMRRGLERALLRDALFTSAVAGTVRPRAADIAEGLRRYSHVLRVLVLLSRTEPGARAVALAARSERSLDSLVNAAPSSAIADVDTLEVSYGSGDEKLEGEAYAMGGSRVSTPFKAGEGAWAVLVILDRTENPVCLKQTEDDRRRSVVKILQRRLDAAASEAFMQKVLAPRHARAQEGPFRALGDAISNVWLEDSTRYRRPAGYQLTSDMVDVLLRTLGESADAALVELEDGTMSVGDVLETLRYESFVSPEPSGDAFLARLNAMVRRAAGFEYLAREARARHLDNRASFREDMRMWTDHWAARAQYYATRDTVVVGTDPGTPGAAEARRETAVARLIAKLAADRGVRIDAKAVKALRITLIPMFTRRHLGFGGIMSAAPILLPVWDWIDEAPGIPGLDL